MCANPTETQGLLFNCQAGAYSKKEKRKLLDVCTFMVHQIMIAFICDAAVSRTVF